MITRRLHATMPLLSLFSRPAACLLVAVVVSAAGALQAAEPVRMGCGIMTFDTVPGWGLDREGKSQIGPTHGSVVIDSEGQIYTSSNIGIFVFSPDGTLVRRYLGDDYTSLHDMEIRSEDGRDVIYGARNAAGEGIKIDAATGKVLLKLGIPTEEECGVKIASWAPTAITVAPSGEIYLSDGYASNRIFRFSPDGTYLSHFGTKGNGMREFNTAHGMTLDTRYDPPRLLICDRNHEPKGRLLHYSLEGEFLEEVITGLGMPTSVAIQGEYVSVPDLHGRLVILDGSNTIMAVLGHNPDPATRGSFKVPQEQWKEGIFSGTHGSFWDADGNLYVQDWNVSGRIMKLVRAAAERGPEATTAAGGELGEIVELGRTLVAETASHPLTRDYVGAALNCTSCHLENGTHPTAATFLDVATAYPAWAPREGRVVTLEDRVLNCFMRSCNGTRPPQGSLPAVAITTYITALSAGRPMRMNDASPHGPRRVPALAIDLTTADAEAGRPLYTQRCAGCHGEDGNGTDDGPAVWGERSFNTGAGLSHVEHLAAYLKLSMPLHEADLSEREALDIAAYVNSHERPLFAIEEHLPPQEQMGVYNGTRGPTDAVDDGR